MGLDLVALLALRVAADTSRLGRVLTLGRQELHIDGIEARSAGLTEQQISYCQGRFSEDFLKGAFGAKSVDSIDASGYQNSTFVHNLNKRLPNELCAQWDTVLDFGTLEHVYDVAQALQNVADAVKEGGRLIHVVPTNGFSGHGFYQFSPELFFSKYSVKRGFRATNVFVVSALNAYSWYRVTQPSNGTRTEIVSPGPVYCVCFTTKSSQAAHETVLQSDYVSLWNSTSQQSNELGSKTNYKMPVKNARAALLDALPVIRAMFTSVYLWIHAVSRAHRQIWSNQPLEKLDARSVQSVLCSNTETSHSADENERSQY
jgi:SAM-dependent methyltransferase